LDSEVVWIFTEPSAILVMPSSLLRTVGCFLFKEAYFYDDWLPVTPRCASRGRINRREVKQIYNKYKPKKRQVPPPEPIDLDDQFLDFVDLLDPLASELPVGGP
jgi:hypothetical protein